MLYFFVINIPPVELEMFGWGYQSAPMIRNVLLTVMQITVIYVDIHECDGKFDKKVENHYYACAKVQDDHRRVEKVINYINLIICIEKLFLYF